MHSPPLLSRGMHASFSRRSRCAGTISRSYACASRSPLSAGSTSSLSPEEQKSLALRLQALASKPPRARDADGMRACIAECVACSDELAPRTLASIMGCLGRLRSTASEEALATMTVAAAGALRERPGDFNELDVSSLASTLARARRHRSDASGAFLESLSRFLEALAAREERRLAEFFTAQGLAMTLNSFAALRQAPSRLLSAALGEAVDVHASSFSAAQLSNVLNSLARLRLGAILEADVGRWRGLVGARIQEFNVQGLSNVLNAYARLMVSDARLVADASRRLAELSPQDYGEQEVANILNACSRLQVSDCRLLCFLDHGVISRLVPAFTSQGLANSMLAFARLSFAARHAGPLANECVRRASSQGLIAWEEPHHIVNVVFSAALLRASKPSVRCWPDCFESVLLQELARITGHAQRSSASSVRVSTSHGRQKLSPEAVTQLYAVLTEIGFCFDRMLHTWPIERLRSCASILEGCDVEFMQKSFREGVHAEVYVERSSFHREVSAVIGPICSGGCMLVEEAFVAPYVVDILLIALPGVLL